MIKHATIRIYGKVQGVFFRAGAKMRAEDLGLAGFVRNSGNGTVLVEAEGQEKELLQFLKWCKSGPPAAEIEKVDSNITNDLADFKTFEIL